ncbi:MAG: hypothetical protein ACK502_10070 [Alphaproteobacteria bacterium]
MAHHTTHNLPPQNPQDDAAQKRLAEIRHHQRAIRAKRVAVTRSASVMLGAALALNAFRSPPDQPSREFVPPSAVRVTEPPPRTSLSELQVLPFVDRVQAENNERSSVNIATEIGTVVDISAADFIKHHFSIYQDEGSNVIVLRPLQQSTESRVLYYLAPDFDPLHILKHDASPEIVKAALDQCREDLRSGESTYLGSIEQEHLRKREVKINPVSFISNAEPLEIKIDSQQRILFRITFDQQQLAKLQWLNQAIRIADNTLHDIDAEFRNPDLLADFVKEAVIDPKTSRFDPVAKKALRNLFALSPNDRKAFAEAVSTNKTSKAKLILLNRHNEPLLPEGIFNALLQYLRDAKDYGLTQQSAADAIEYGRVHYATYDSLQNTSSSEQDYALNFLHKNLTEEQFIKIQNLPTEVALELRIFLGNQDFSIPGNTVYYNFIHNLEQHILKTASQKTGEDATNNLLSDRVLTTIKKYWPEISNIGSGNWFDRNSKDRNLLSIVGLLEARQRLLDILPRGKANLTDLISRINNRGQMTFELPLRQPSDDKMPEIDDSCLRDLSSALWSALESHNALGKTYDDNGRQRPLQERVADLFAYTQTDKNMAVEHCGAPGLIANILSRVAPVSIQLPDLTSHTPTNNAGGIILSNTRTMGNITLSNIAITAQVERNSIPSASGQQPNVRR